MENENTQVNMRHPGLSPELAQYAARRAAEHAEEAAELCRRWRRLTAVLRCLMLVGLLAGAVAVDSGIMSRRLWACGALTAQQGVSEVTQMLLRS